MKSNHKLLIILKIYFFILLSCSCLFSKAQNNLISDFSQKSDSLKSLIKFEEAIKYRINIYKLDSTLQSNIYELSALYALSKNNDSAFYFLTKATNKDSSCKFLTNPDYIFIINDIRWQLLKEKQFNKYEQKNGRFKKPNLVKLLWEMKLLDQAYYIFTNDFKTYEEGKHIWLKKDSINKMNLVKLDSIIKEVDGWPKISEFGKQASSAAFLVIQHAEPKDQNRYIKLFKKAAKKNEVKKSDLALLIDRNNLYNGKKQIYGSQLAYDNKTYKTYFDYKTLKNPSKVNERRKEMELEPIEDYLKYWNLKWEYKK